MRTIRDGPPRFELPLSPASAHGNLYASNNVSVESRSLKSARVKRMWIRLTRKLANFLNGIDVSDRHVGDVFELPTFSAHLLIAEGWAERYIPVRQPEVFGDRQAGPSESSAAEPWSVETLERLRRLREQANRRHYADVESRRAEDRIREELRDERARTIKPTKPLLRDPGA